MEQNLKFLVSVCTFIIYKFMYKYKFVHIYIYLNVYIVRCTGACTPCAPVAFFPIGVLKSAFTSLVELRGPLTSYSEDPWPPTGSNKGWEAIMVLCLVPFATQIGFRMASPSFFCWWPCSSPPSLSGVKWLSKSRLAFSNCFQANSKSCKFWRMPAKDKW